MRRSNMSSPQGATRKKEHASWLVPGHPEKLDTRLSHNPLGRAKRGGARAHTLRSELAKTQDV